MAVKETLLDIQLCYSDAANAGREPTPQEIADIMERRFPALEKGRKRYWRGMGQFVGSALDGWVIDPKRWTPPE